ncbi:YwlC protein [Lentinula aciculospora]|uniref:Threonylcarbamoyl-AMP synthase n=1 Tax=Lentinula aciculospora TaxID=153920 RepID=A0A9W8ZTH4_9AGAR|nr:YwlC protein [Lentinula aciculospora]
MAMAMAMSKTSGSKLEHEAAKLVAVADILADKARRVMKAIENFHLLRELKKSSVPPHKINPTLASNFRKLSAQARRSEVVLEDLRNAYIFMTSQREHKVLLDRYNPLVDLTAEERIHATARRVGLDMPITHEPENDNCDPSSITFDESTGESKITSQNTLNSLSIAAKHLTNLQPVAFPTETVYGLGALALNNSAASCIFSVKGRPPDNPLIVHVSSLDMLHSLLPSSFKMPKSYELLMKRFWPGALTLLFPSDPNTIPSIITANQPTVAIRMPSHPVARALISLVNTPIAAPSANSSGKPSPTTAEHVRRDLSGKLNLILDGGACGVGLESTVVDGLQEDGKIRVLRPGGITVEDIQETLQEGIRDRESVPQVLVHRRDYRDEELEAAPTTPGMKYRHYSPTALVTLLMTKSPLPKSVVPSNVESFLLSIKDTINPSASVKVGLLTLTDSALGTLALPVVNGVEWCRYELGPSDVPSVTARRLFDGLLTLDQRGVDMILIEEVNETNEGLAIMNRVRKAASEVQWITF